MEFSKDSLDCRSPKVLQYIFFSCNRINETWKKCEWNTLGLSSARAEQDWKRSSCQFLLDETKLLDRARGIVHYNNLR